MSRREPLLQKLKRSVLTLQEQGTPTVSDATPGLNTFCENIEHILRKGLKQSALSFTNKDYWNWIEALSELSYCTRNVPLLSFLVDTVKSRADIFTAQGRGRLLVRVALAKKALSSVVRELARQPCMLQQWYEPDSSIIGNEDMLEPFLSLVNAAAQLSFNLELEVSTFLDESWLLPVRHVYEFVPCKELGALLYYVNGRALVAQLTAGTYVAEDGRLTLGDVIDEINGVSIHNSAKGQALSLLRKARGEPVVLTVTKRVGRDGKVFPPLKSYYRRLHEEAPELHVPREVEERKKAVESGGQEATARPSKVLLDGRLVHTMKYLGSVPVGKEGEVKSINLGIQLVLKGEPQPQEVYLDVRETEVVTVLKSTVKLLITHAYTEISAVGRQLDKPSLFGYCVCSKGADEVRRFECYVFDVGNGDQCEEIIKRIASGFDRTQWTV
ncbi:uncharacterized protein LOC144944490 [Lampetra fluviatilis]